MRPHGARFLLIGLAVIGIGADRREATATSSVGAAHVVGLAGDTTGLGAIGLFVPPSVINAQGTVLSRATIGTTGMGSRPILVGGNARPLDALAASGDVVGDTAIQTFDKVLFGNHGWASFRTAQGTGLAAIDLPGSPFNVVAGIGAQGPAAALRPREIVAAGEWIAILDENPSFELVKLTTMAPFLDPNQVIDVLEVDDQLAGMPVSEFVFDSLSLNPSGIGMARVRRNGTASEAIVQFDAATAATEVKFAVGDPAPGFAPGVNISSINSGATINAGGDYAARVRVIGPGISGSDDVLYFFDAADQVRGFVQEDTQIPGAGPNQVFSNIAAPFVAGTGARRRRLWRVRAELLCPESQWSPRLPRRGGQQRLHVLRTRYRRRRGRALSDHRSRRPGR